LQKDDVPTARSGHTLNCIGGVNYLLYGGIEDSKNGKIQPDPNCYQMRLMASKFKYFKLKIFFVNKFKFENASFQNLQNFIFKKMRSNFFYR
jgi:hypothetical protein